jgi:putative copper resistance protein D
MSPDAALVLCRFLQDASAMLVWGTFACLSWLVPGELARVLASRLRFFRLVAIAVAVATTLAALPIETAVIGEGWADAFDLTMIRAVLFETSVGLAWFPRAVAALLLVVTLFAPPRLRQSATAFASGLLLASFALTGHAAMYERWLGVAHRINDVVHLLAGGWWVGSLSLLFLVLRALENAKDGGDAATALYRFSAIGHAAVALVVFSGVVNTCLVLRQLPINWSSPYQVLLLAKIGCVAVMIGLAIINRYVLVPRLRSTRHALPLLEAATTAEVALGLTAIGLVSFFGMLEPV